MRALVIGGDSVVGAALVRALTQRGDTVYATTRRRNTVNGDSLHLDLADDGIETVPLPVTDIAFFCAAVSGFAVCRNDPVLARRVNVEGTGKLARRLTRQGVYSVLLSSTAVFDFQRPRVPADAPLRPLTMLGQIKAEAERTFLALGQAASVLRLTKVVTPDAPLFAEWIAALRRHSSISAYSDLHIAPISLADATRAMFAVAGDRGSGIYQVSGASDISYLDVARHLAKMMGVPPGRIRSKLAVENGIPASEVPRFTTLESSRIEALTGCGAPDPYDLIETIFEPQIESFDAIEASSGGS
jgi:dTDP-4-dehydrorhamnose reductase